MAFTRFLSSDLIKYMLKYMLYKKIIIFHCVPLSRDASLPLSVHLG